MLYSSPLGSRAHDPHVCSDRQDITRLRQRDGLGPRASLLLQTGWLGPRAPLLRQANRLGPHAHMTVGSAGWGPLRPSSRLGCRSRLTADEKHPLRIHVARADSWCFLDA
ncbi:hypothetical protein VNO78_16606 [Psophocarpus tetragonolobus]|uniref:Uncharacterized protein n=1 Tax=Psophocarpus tetragonolobus TaxID=3891 RepID=A0AAN9SII8_PSOTE